MAEPYLDLGNGLVVYSHPMMPTDTILIGPHPRFEMGPFLFEEIPEEIDDLAVDIAHTSMAKTLAYLRAAGHDIPTWQQRRDARERGRQWRYRAETRMELSIFPPGSVAKITCT